jgi:hypothetical protein
MIGILFLAAVATAWNETQELSNEFDHVRPLKTRFSQFRKLKPALEDCVLSEDGRYLAFESEKYAIAIVDLVRGTVLNKRGYVAIESWSPLRGAYYDDSQQRFRPKERKGGATESRTRDLLSISGAYEMLLLDATGKFSGATRNIFFLIDYMPGREGIDPNLTFHLPSWSYVPLRCVTMQNSIWLLLAGRQSRHSTGPASDNYLSRKDRFQFESYEITKGKNLRRVPLNSVGNPFRSLPMNASFPSFLLDNHRLSGLDDMRRSLFYVGIKTKPRQGQKRDPIVQLTLTNGKRNSIPISERYDFAEPIFCEGQVFLNGWIGTFPPERPRLELLKWDFAKKKWNKIGPYNVIATSGSKEVLLLEGTDGRMIIASPRSGQ